MSTAGKAAVYLGIICMENLFLSSDMQDQQSFVIKMFASTHQPEKLIHQAIAVRGLLSKLTFR